MITISIQGGLGNQMFQYAVARSLSIKYNTPLTLNISYFLNIPKGDVPRRYQLDIYNVDNNISIDESPNSLLVKITLKVILKFLGEGVQIFFAKIFLKLGLPTILYGSFQNVSYIEGYRDVLLNEFTLKKEISEKTKQIKERLEKNRSVCVNIRRGDYLRPDYIKLYGLCDMQYYKKAMGIVKSRIDNPLFCVFSDDPEWVKDQFSGENIIYAGNDVLKDYEQMYLMSICKHNIIANSSFAWWGAWLNKNPEKIVVAPKQWFAKKTADALGILPSTWIRI